MTRTTLFLAATAFALSMAGAPAQAEDTDINPPPSAEDLKGACKAAHGKFIEVTDGSFYGCKTQCTGGACAVLCSDGKCFGTTPDRRQTSNGPRAVTDTFAGKLGMREQDDGYDHGRGKDGVPWGWLGLLGLVGLIGLKRSPAASGVNRG
ncbi:WGxxGxxG-CTERM domain-containing protein [Sphingomonas alba]|uniref:WGxxGxxG-CTERM domain-containing protein n=1 Tax=Sphingomonas alba TaxID=2908208 RepID=A0ABT0RPJ4_9SPHN|nr:WGxxGxxG-CTERM domain-containing protein [Sphingomonas alba]MCL6684563.1 WGxxGxxG-CTERM domain-containing protein [Sphingomonas alba]